MEIISRADETRRDETRIDQINQSINQSMKSSNQFYRRPTRSVLVRTRNAPDAFRPTLVVARNRARVDPNRRLAPWKKPISIRSDPIESIDPRRFDAIIITEAARRGNRFDPIRPGARRGWVRLRLPNGATLRTMKRNERALRGRSGATSVVWRWTTGVRMWMMIGSRVFGHLDYM